MLPDEVGDPSLVSRVGLDGNGAEARGPAGEKASEAGEPSPWRSPERAPWDADATRDRPGDFAAIVPGSRGPVIAPACHHGSLIEIELGR